MSGQMRDWILAVDGGGTRCRLALVSGEKDVRVEVGPANVTSNTEAAIRELTAGLSVLAARAGLTLDLVCQVPAYLGLAGYQAERDLERFRVEMPLERVKIEDDRPAALRGALGGGDGALIHSGTGSFFGFQTGGQQRFCGGWGAVLGDEGSAAWFGRAVLSQVLNAEDGLVEKTQLSEKLKTQLGGVAGVLSFANSAAPADFGALAPLILTEADDPIAQALISRAAGHFDENLRHLGWRGDAPVCLTGGLAPNLSPYLTEDVRNCLTRAAGAPIDGAIALAREFAAEANVSC